MKCQHIHAKLEKKPGGMFMEMHFCQSCGMPVTEELLGTEANGEKNPDYCTYCYQKGAFTFPGATMEQMIEVCVPHMLEANPGMTEAQARAMMEGFLPSLSRWR